MRRDADFKRLRHVGRSVSHPTMTLSVTRNALPHNRYGFIVSKRVGSAVQRNRTRRLLREAVRLLHPHLSVGFDVVIIARQSLVGQPFRAVQRIIEEQFRRAKLVEKDVS